MKLKNGNRAELIKNLTGKEIVCFGCGEIFTNVLKDNELSQYIKCVFDNDESKDGTFIEAGDRNIPVVHVKSILQVIENPDSSILLITTASWLGIYEQLEKQKELRAMDCWVYVFVTERPDLNLSDFYKENICCDLYRNRHRRLEELKLKDAFNGRRCFIIGNGPSLKIEDLEKLHDEITFASNRIYLLFDKTNWRPDYYFCIDRITYHNDLEKIKEIETGKKFVYSQVVERYGDAVDETVYYIDRKKSRFSYTDKDFEDLKFSSDITQNTYQGGSVSYDMMQFAAYMGFKEIYLLGMDNTYSREKDINNKKIFNDCVNHFSDEYEKGFSNYVVDIYYLNRAWETAEAYAGAHGIKIYNATRGGKLETFERVDFDSLDL